MCPHFLCDIIEKILDLLFPNVCGICEKLSSKAICNECILEINKYKKIKRIKKLKSLKLKLKSEIYFDEQIYFFKYENLIREKIIQYKFNNKSYLYKMFAKAIETSQLKDFCKNYELIIPVPISKKRMQKRGYNQSLLIVKEIVKTIVNLKLEKDVLIKIKDIKPQTEMYTREQRIENVKDVYLVKNNEKIKNRKIIIFDDIFTTGSTVNECAKILKQAGAQKIGIITIAKD